MKGPLLWSGSSSPAALSYWSAQLDLAGFRYLPGGSLEFRVLLKTFVDSPIEPALFSLRDELFAPLGDT